MAMSRSARITLLLVIDVLFFFVELIVGYSVGSLALVADSFHMLNDVMSLIVALYAIKLTASSAVNPQYSYGWHRAEILAALVNGVFLLALCFSIALEAIVRFFSTPEISNPKLIVVVGSLGLASNIVGLFLFHEHGHSHAHPPSKPPSVTTPSRPESITAGASPTQKVPSRVRSRSRSPSQSELIYGHPAATRASLVQTAQEMARARSPSPTRHRNSISYSRPSVDTESSAQTLPTSRFTDSPIAENEPSGGLSTEGTPLLHDEAEESLDRGPRAHGHSHAGSMNMRALVLHVMGDALGNVGVIATGLIIWLTEWSFKYYFDPIISLVITAIIFSSALPLVKSASFILLQGVPMTISLESVRESILRVQGVLSLHELHVWQLSESKIIASVHVITSRDHDFMSIAVKIRNALHHHGIHSSTIQPEYLCPGIGAAEEQFKGNGATPCLVLCPPDEACDPAENACCPPPPMEV
ncbi:cation efflux protein [Lyophyllum atratum]|nr:cation efflux protein [Lyophyllum atratum]